MDRKTALQLASMLCIAIAAACSSSNHQPLDAQALKKFQACNSAADCVFAQNGCCDCANGGASIAINQNQQDAFEAQFDCENVACTEIAAVPACNVGTISCEDDLCKFTRP